MLTVPGVPTPSPGIVALAHASARALCNTHAVLSALWGRAAEGSGCISTARSRVARTTTTSTATVAPTSTYVKRATRTAASTGGATASIAASFDSDRSKYRSRSGNLARVADDVRSLPLPADPVLASWASALNDAGYWAYVFDAGWRLMFVTEELLMTFRDMGRSAVPVGSHYYSAEAVRSRDAMYRDGSAASEQIRAGFLNIGGFVLASTPGGRDELRQVVDPALADLVDELQPIDVPAAWIERPEWTTAGADVAGSVLYFRIDDGHGGLAGFGLLSKPAAGMSHLGRAVAVADLAHLERMRAVERPDRRSAAILMADLEASSPLARHLSTAEYFAFGRRLVRAADRCVIDAGGIVGRHAGDGVVAFFLADTSGSESAAARSCITAARTLRGVLPDIAERSDLAESDVSFRFGLHWGSTLYMGRILTGGRSEVNALGDEVNETARIEACASGGRTLASKALIERLTHTDAEDLGLDTRHTTYTPLADLATATDKARRDAPSIAVCEV